MNKDTLKHTLRNGLVSRGDVEYLVDHLSEVECRELLKSIIYVFNHSVKAYVEYFIDRWEE